MGNKKEPSLLSTPLHGIYIPASLLVVGTAIINRSWVPYAVGVALVLSGFKVYRGRKLIPNLQKFHKVVVIGDVATCVVAADVRKEAKKEYRTNEAWKQNRPRSSGKTNSKSLSFKIRPFSRTMLLCKFLKKILGGETKLT